MLLKFTNTLFYAVKKFGKPKYFGIVYIATMKKANFNIASSLPTI
ncbi:MAG: hypothetical protein ABDH28_05085 [Brevinematia bacterium]